MFDLILGNATILDGTGGDPYKADIGIAGEKITAIGDLDESEARRKIDASGRVVCPGFIDVHSHADLTLFREDSAEILSPLVLQGITTFVGGNCGIALSPITEEHREGLKTYLELFTQMDFDAAIHWDTMGSFMDLVEKSGLLLNMALLVPHGMLRISAAGLEAHLANDAEIVSMRRVLEESMEAGAFGLSTGLQYVPGSQSDTKELIDVAEPLARFGGIFTSHLRSYTNTTLDKAIGEVADVARANEIQGHVSHIFSSPWLEEPALEQVKWLTSNPDRALSMVPDSTLDAEMNKILEQLDEERQSGTHITMDILPTTLGFTHLLAFFPPWTVAESKAMILDRIRDPKTRSEILQDIETGEPIWPHRGRNDWSLNVMRQFGWDSVTIMAVHEERNKHLEGRRFTEIAEESGKHPFDVMCDLLLEEDGRVLAFVSLSETADDALTERTRFPAFKDHQTMIATDTILLGMGKPSYLFYGCYPKFIHRYVYDKGLISLPKAIERCTALPAKEFGIKKRGLIKEGYFADILVLDAEKFTTKADFQDPEQYPEGLHMTLINGEVVVEEGSVNTRALPGKMLRKNKQ